VSRKIGHRLEANLDGRVQGVQPRPSRQNEIRGASLPGDPYAPSHRANKQRAAGTPVARL